MSKYTLLYNLLVGFLLLHFAGFSQADIVGDVTNEAGEPLVGVTLQVLNSTASAVTDENGVYIF